MFKPDIMADINGNNLKSKEFTMDLGVFKYFDPGKQIQIYIYIYILADEKVVSSSGNTVLYSMLGLLSFNLLVAIVCSSSMSFLFPLFNMLQLINLMPLLEVDLPENLRSFIGIYLQFANLKFDFMYNPFHKWGIIDLTEVNYNPLNDNFERNGIMSKAFLVNYGGQLIFWTIIIFLYIPISIIAKCCGWSKFKELKRAYEYGVLLTSFSEAFVEFALLSFLTMFQVQIYHLF